MSERGTPLRFGAALSTISETAAALRDACRRAAAQLDGPADLAIVFATPHHSLAVVEAGGVVQRLTGARNLLGCSAEAVLGVGREVEGQPAIALWLASLPATTLHPMHLDLAETAEGISFTGWPEVLPDSWPAGSALLLIGDPFTFPADELLTRLNEDQPGVPVIGGMASGAVQAGQNHLLLGSDIHDSGAVAVLLEGGVRVRSVVSQGCRPIGSHYVVTRAEHNIIVELSGQPPLRRLQEIFDGLDVREQKLVRKGLHVGRVINEYQDHFGPGDFLVRNVIGADAESGAIMIGDFVRPGQTVQFHVRDAHTADEDLRDLLARSREAGSAAGALLFTCNGRGTRLFEQPDHDAGTLQECLGAIPTVGFFAAGELGPIGGRNFLHGFTASIALFCPE